MGIPLCHLLNTAMNEFPPSLMQLHIIQRLKLLRWNCQTKSVLLCYFCFILFEINRSQLYGEMVGSISGHMLWKWPTFCISWQFVSSATVMYVSLREKDESTQVLRELLGDSMLCHTIRPRWQIPSVTGDSTCFVSSHSF